MSFYEVPIGSHIESLVDMNCIFIKNLEGQGFSYPIGRTDSIRNILFYTECICQRRDISGDQIRSALKQADEIIAFRHERVPPTETAWLTPIRMIEFLRFSAIENSIDKVISDSELNLNDRYEASMVVGPRGIMTNMIYFSKDRSKDWRVIVGFMAIRISRRKK